MPSTDDNGNRISGSKYASNRRIVHEFGSYLLAHYRIVQSLDTIDPYLLRERVNDLMKEWIDNGYRCNRRGCRYCKEAAPSKDFVRKFQDKLGSKSEVIGYRRKEHDEH